MNSTGFLVLAFDHPELHVFMLPALFGDFSAVMGDDGPDLVELVRFDQECK